MVLSNLINSHYSILSGHQEGVIESKVTKNYETQMTPIILKWVREIKKTKLSNLPQSLMNKRPLY